MRQVQAAVHGYARRGGHCLGTGQRAPQRRAHGDRCTDIAAGRMGEAFLLLRRHEVGAVPVHIGGTGAAAALELAVPHQDQAMVGRRLGLRPAPMLATAGHRVYRV